MNETGRLIILSGPSGSGKTTLCKQLMKDPRVKRSVSFTTREPRGREQDGVDYHFITIRRFERLIKEGKFLEYAEYCGSYYGTPLEPVEEAIKEGELFILAIDVKGALQVMEKIPETTSIFIMAPDEGALRKRLEDRVTDSATDINKRVEEAEIELKYRDRYDHCVVNDELEVAVSEIKNILGLS
ncbi:MAG: guanylate kinase [Candidatus Scalindua sp.]|nr:guanylate kinase [Planctomycetota bacterium]GJQ58119.1 MAG: guanylate kinase [Candidatus Scalindua sp.]